MILVRLILAHLLGDFILQPKSWVIAKEKKKLKAWQLYIHSLIHFVLIMVLVWQAGFILWAVLLTAVHLIADIVKIYFQKNSTKRMWFFTDQIFHLLVISIVWVISQSIPINTSLLINEKSVLIITCFYALTMPVSVVIRNIISKWTPDTNPHTYDSLTNAGNYIGMLERLFVFTFVITGNWNAIGFLLAAKSVFRFGDLKDSKDRKLTEYVLIGTLLSFGIALAIGLVYVALYPVTSNE